MLSVFDKLHDELKKMGYHPVETEILSAKGWKIEIDLAEREEPGELIIALFSPDAISDLMQKEVHASIVNMLYFFPDTFDQHALYEARLLADRCNGCALLPGFAVDDLHGKLFFRYSLPLVSLSQNAGLLKIAIGLVCDTIDIYSHLFMQIAEGASYATVVEEALRDYLLVISSKESE